MSPKTLISFCGIGLGGVAPLVYIVSKEFDSSSSKESLKILGDRMSWECRIQGFEEMDLKWVFYNSPFFKKLHCHKDKQYDWQIFLPNALFKDVNFDTNKSLNLISVQKEDNISPIKIFQEEKTLSQDWLLMKHINSYNISEKAGENRKYLGLYEFELLNSDRKVGKAWVVL